MVILVKTKKHKNKKQKKQKTKKTKKTKKQSFLNLLKKCLVGWMRPGEG